MPKTKYLFGFPQELGIGGLEMDMDNIKTFAGSLKNDVAQKNSGLRNLGVISSGLEHVVPEQMLSTSSAPVEAVSAVKLLAIANENGQRIYHVTVNNGDLVIPNLQLSNPARSEIVSSIDVGMEVIVHSDDLTVNGWSGRGYIIFDPDGGSGAYKISGGLNGSASILPVCQGSFFESVVAFWLMTNKAIPGLALPFGATFLTAASTAKAVGGMTFIDALAYWGGYQAANAFVAALFTAIINFIIFALIFEIGILIGSIISAAICRKK